MRFIIDKLRPAPFNMAADLYLLNQCERNGVGGVTVRFYSWQRPSITLGYMQSASEELDLQSVRLTGVDWIRRPTGGRAVFHDGDITYSCVFPKSLSSMGNGITQTYRIITECLLKGLDKASIKCDAHGSSAELKGLKREVKLPCFLAPNRDEIMVGGKKLVGSAQKRTAEAVLQHGSIPITDACFRLPDFLRISESEKDNQKKLLRVKSSYANEWVTDVTFDTLSQCLMDGFSSVLPFKAEACNWDAGEEAAINEIAESEDFMTLWKTESPCVGNGL
ncbi:MAG: lipoate--protein ligase family protein [Chitinispirillales bacterium]|jgi:lipoate-protein ligase A|nr:lipoate--protein ligase family protein [Chitinispirillales bacterium]